MSQCYPKMHESKLRLVNELPFSIREKVRTILLSPEYVWSEKIRKVIDIINENEGLFIDKNDFISIKALFESNYKVGERRENRVPFIGKDKRTYHFIN